MKRSGPSGHTHIGHALHPNRAIYSSSASSLPCMSLWPGTHRNSTLWVDHRLVNWLIMFSTSLQLILTLQDA